MGCAHILSGNIWAETQVLDLIIYFEEDVNVLCVQMHITKRIEVGPAVQQWAMRLNI